MAEPTPAQSPVLKVPVLKVMVSSTAIDLPDHRPQVMNACLSEGMLPKMMEHLPARAPVLKKITRETLPYA